MYLYNEKNSGKGYSVKKGCMVANGEWVVFMDGDFPFDFVVIEKMIPDFLNENIDMIIGDRTQKDSSYPSDLPLMRKMGSRVLSAIAGRFFTGNFFDTQCGIKAFRKPVAADLFGQLTQNRFSFDLEILFLATRKKLKITRVAVLVRHQSNSTVRIFKDGLGMGMALVVIYFNKISGYYKI